MQTRVFKQFGSFSLPARRSREHNLRLLGRAVRDLREQRGLQTDALAAGAGMSIADLAAVEAGHRDPGFRGLLRLAEGLGVRPVALLARIEEIDASDVD